MPGADLNNVIGFVYDAASGELSWDSAGQELRRLVGANTVSLWVGQPAVGRVEMLCTTEVPDPDWAQRVYAERYFALDTWTTAVIREFATEARPRVWLGPELVPQQDYQRSEFYQDFARRLGVFELIAACAPIADGDSVFLGLHRPEGVEGFSERDRQVLVQVLPHLQRALVLRRRLSASPRAPLSTAALELTGNAVVIVDADARILFASTAAEALMAEGAAVRGSRTGPTAGATRVLGAAHKTDDAELRGLVRATSLGRGAGATLMLRGPLPAENLAALVSRIPGALAPSGPFSGAVMVMLRPLARRRSHDPRLLAGMLGITQAEAEVAAALSGGRSAEAVAAERGVSVATVRTQVRRLLDKLGVANLRELEALLASLPELPGGTGA